MNITPTSTLKLTHWEEKQEYLTSKKSLDALVFQGRITNKTRHGPIRIEIFRGKIKQINQ